MTQQGSTSPSVLRVFRFRPAHAAFDSTLRDVMLPDLVAMEGLRAVYAGRQGPGELGDRLVASVWTTEAAMVAAVGADFDRPTFHPEFIDDSLDKRLDKLPIAFALEPAEEVSAPVLRLVIGTVASGRLGEYERRVADGTRDDVETGRGPLALYLATDPDGRFATLSVWGQWSKVAEATGGSVGQPTRTRHAELLAEWTTAHYEGIFAGTRGDTSGLVVRSAATGSFAGISGRIEGDPTAVI
ncbi:MAG TPA: hypothetical protein VFR93_08295 [Candidatus Limnocylindrales bacterium]|nr:hypothetical protein [Candidatus Limnocylindrales bacterium]